jgi:hypothetical protein
MKLEWRNLYIQTDEILSELKKDEVNIYAIIKLLKELLEDLVSQTTARGLLEISHVCVLITFRNDYWTKLRESLEDFMSECLTLDDYPSKFALASPEEILKEIIEVYNDLGIAEMNILTKRERILKSFTDGIDVLEISKSLDEDAYYVERVLFKAGRINGYSENSHLDILKYIE